MTEMIPWEQMRAEALESGQVTPDALAQVAQEAMLSATAWRSRGIRP